MTWRVRLIETAHGRAWDDGVIVNDRREGAHDLIEEANNIMGTVMLDGEVYEITPVPAVRRYCVDGSAVRAI